MLSQAEIMEAGKGMGERRRRTYLGLDNSGWSILWLKDVERNKKRQMEPNLMSLSIFGGTNFWILVNFKSSLLYLGC